MALPHTETRLSIPSEGRRPFPAHRSPVLTESKLVERTKSGFETRMSLLLFFVALLTLSLAADDTCPSPEDIDPCTCSKEQPYGVSMLCSRLETSSQLASALEGFNGRSFYKVTVKNSNLGDLSADIFQRIRALNTIEFQLTEMTTLGRTNQPPFLGLENSLVALIISECFKKQPLTRFIVSHMKKMSYLVLRSNLIPTIPNDWFESGPYAMKTLYLIDNSVETLGSHAFAFLVKLQTLWLTGNKIASFSRSMLPSPAQSLEELDLSDNQLQSFPNDMFIEMPSLKKISLKRNGFTTISQAIFSPVWSQLQSVGFGGNAINCNAQLKWIYEIRRPQSLIGSCSSPKKLKGTKLKKLKSEDLK